jgi:hypothetical protein
MAALTRVRMNFSAFPSFWQDRRTVRTTAIPRGAPNDGRGPIAIFPGIGSPRTKSERPPPSVGPYPQGGETSEKNEARIRAFLSKALPSGG